MNAPNDNMNGGLVAQGRAGPRSGALREAAALEPAQVQLLPLRHRALRPHGAAHRDRAHRLHLVHRKGPGQWAIRIEGGQPKMCHHIDAG